MMPMNKSVFPVVSVFLVCNFLFNFAAKSILATVNIKIRFFILILIILPLYSQAQKIVETDSTLRKSAYMLLDRMRDGKPVDTLSPRVIVLGNEECGHCKDMQKYLTDAGVVFEDYDITKDPRFFNLIIDFYTKRSDGSGIAVSYPAVAANGKMYNNITDMKAFAAGLKNMQELMK